MSINKPLFNDIYNECLKIIEESQDKNILSKKKKIDAAYNELCSLEDHEYQNFYSIVHELRLYGYLKQIGIYISAANDNKAGPDFISDLGYIECVCLTKGEKGTPQREWLDKRLSGSMNRYISALPRLTSVILDKHKKFQEYISSNKIDKSISKIIAVNTSIFSNEFHSSLNLDLALKVLYGIGCQTMRFDMKKNSFIAEKGVETHAYEDVGVKPPLNVVLPLNYFSQDCFSDISGVLLINNSIGKSLNKGYFNLLLNPYADTPVDMNILSEIKYFALKSIENGFANFEWHNQKN